MREGLGKAVCRPREESEGKGGENRGSSKMSGREPVYRDVRGRVWEFEGRREEFKGWRDEFKGGESRRTEMFAGGSRKRSLKGGERGVPECSQE